MIVQKTSVFPASKNTVFQKLRQLETLQYIAWPFAAFEPVSDGVPVWTAGSTSSYHFRLFEVIPFGTHTIHILRFDPDGISSREGNEHVPIVGWVLSLVFQSPFGDRFMYRHSMKAPDEMRQLHEQFYSWLA